MFCLDYVYDLYVERKFGVLSVNLIFLNSLFVWKGNSIWGENFCGFLSFSVKVIMRFLVIDCYFWLGIVFCGFLMEGDNCDLTYAWRVIFGDSSGKLQILFVVTLHLLEYKCWHNERKRGFFSKLRTSLLLEIRR